jgi:HK97 family phage major capsid protein
VEETTTSVEAPAVEAAAVEAARPTVAASHYVKERTAPITSAQYLEASIKAAMGDDAARRTVLAADDSTTTNTGLTLPGHLNEFVTTTFTGRPAFEAVTRNALPDSGMSFTIPKLTGAPTVADADEATTISTTGMTSTYDTVTVNKFAGRNVISWELVDRSSPQFMELLMTELRKAYEASTDAALIAAFTASGTQATGVAATAAGLQSFISVEAAKAYKATGGDYANKLVASTDQWAAIAGYADTTGRALYSAQGPTYNASGAVVPTAAMGNVLGTSLIVDHNIAVSGIVDESAFLVAPGSVQVWESPTTQLRLNILSTGELEVALYGYLAIGVLKGGAGVRRFNLA